ncbi:hypothetical protein [Mycobacteroides chelonae]|uniref:hypothetical protein n=1 Tax=Mycobacteroides chelonae TaxID=1774 RepID=UPI0009C04DC4|nr:hypothetical protein [Mycobacteroides chelonae]
MAWSPADEIGERDALLPAARKYLSRFSYGAKLKGTTSDVIDVDYLAAQRQFKVNRHAEVITGRKPGPDLDPGSSAFDWATKKQMGLLQSDPVIKPAFFTVEGHKSNMFIGPCAYVASTLEREGRVIHWPTGYDTNKLPFDNKGGREALVARLDSKVRDDGVPFPVGTPWEIAGFSQGAMILCEVMEKDVLPENGRLHYRLADFRKGIAFGNPYRLLNQCAPWVPDPPQPDTEGIMDWHFDFTKYPELAGKWQEHSRTRDWYAEKKLDEAGANMTAIAKIITQSDWTHGPASIVARVMDLFTDPFDGLIDIVWAMVRTVMGISQLEAHGTYDLGPVLDWFRAA